MAAKKAAKVAKVMGEYKRGTLKSSSGRKVTSRQQAVAIAMSEAKMPKKKRSPNKSKKNSEPPIYDDKKFTFRPKDRDDVLLPAFPYQLGRKTVYRGKAKYDKLPPKKSYKGIKRSVQA